MKRFLRIPVLSLGLTGLLAGSLLCNTASAQHGGFGHAGFAGHAGYGYHGGYGYRGGYGWGGRYYGGWGWGWGWGLGLGLYFATLPLYYSTLWWEGVPYYYADNTYYRWNGVVGQYETVMPPAGLQGGTAAAPAAPSELIAYPKNGQTAEKQATDKYECHKWAVGQTGFDPAAGGAAPGTPVGNKRFDYQRAQAACLEGRGYSVK